MSDDEEVVNMILGILTSFAVFAIFILTLMIFMAFRTRKEFLSLMSSMQENYGKITLNRWVELHSSGGKGISYSEMVRILSNRKLHPIQPPSRTHPDIDNKMREYHAQKISHSNSILVEEVKAYAEQVYNRRMNEKNTLNLSQILE